MSTTLTETPRARVQRFVADNSGLDNGSLLDHAVLEFDNDPEVVAIALRQYVLLARSDLAAKTRTALSRTQGKSDDQVLSLMERWQESINGSYRGILDCTRPQLLEYVDVHTTEVAAKMRHINGVRALATSLPNDTTTLRGFFFQSEESQQQLLKIIRRNEEEA